MTGTGEVLRLMGYEALTPQGFALPLFASTGRANRWYTADASLPGDPTATIASFRPHTPEQPVGLSADMYREARVGDPWLDVFLWEQVPHVGRAIDIWQALTPTRDAISAQAPLSLLGLATQAEQDPESWALAARDWRADEFGPESAHHWVVETYLRGLAVSQLRRQLGSAVASGSKRRALFEVALVEDGGRLVMEVPRALADLLETGGAAQFATLRTAAESFGLEWAGARTAGRQMASAAPSITTKTNDTFDLHRVHAMILSGEPVPFHWIPYITDLNFRNSELRDLSFLREFTSLQNLDISFTRVSDLSALKKINSLQKFNIDGTSVADLEPLRDLLALRELGLMGTQIVNVSPIEDLRTLRKLDLSLSQVEDLAPIKSLIALSHLNLWNTRISDLSFISNMKQLESLCLNHSRVADLSPISKITSLRYLYLSRTPVKNLSALENLTSLNYLDLDETDIDNIDSVSALTSLWYIGLKSTRISSISPLSGLKSLRLLDIRKTNISDISPVNDHKGLLIQFRDGYRRAARNLRADGFPQQQGDPK